MATITLEMFIGSTPAWTDVTEDALARVPIVWSRGIMGSAPNDLVAQPGSLTFALNNGASNSAGTPGYYAPDHDDVREGFAQGTKVRLLIDAGGGVTRYVFAGKLLTAEPDALTDQEGATHCVATDWMQELADFDDLQLELQEDKRADQLIQELIDRIGASAAPENTDLDVGIDTYEFAYDDLGGRQPKAMVIAQSVLENERGFLYVRGNTTDGETLRMENRHARLLASSEDTITGAHFPKGGLIVPSALGRIINFVEYAVYPRAVDILATTPLVKLNNEVPVGAGETVTLFVDYRDPDNEAEFVGGTDMEQPVADTDYTANRTSGGGGPDITADFSVTLTEFGSRCQLDIENTGTQLGYLRGPNDEGGMQARGRGLYRYAPFVDSEFNSSSLGTYGHRPMDAPLDMPYQDDRFVGAALAELLVAVYGDLQHVPTEVALITEVEDNLQAFLPRDIGDMVTITMPELSGVGDKDVFINGIQGQITRGGFVSIRWILGPSPEEEGGFTFFVLDDATDGLLDSGGTLGYA